MFVCFFLFIYIYIYIFIFCALCDKDGEFRRKPPKTREREREREKERVNERSKQARKQASSREGITQVSESVLQSQLKRIRRASKGPKGTCALTPEFPVT